MPSQCVTRTVAVYPGNVTDVTSDNLTAGCCILMCRHDTEVLTLVLMQGNNVMVQMGNTAAASMDMTPLVEAFENMMSSVPQLQQLFQAPLAAQAGWAAHGGQAGHASQAQQHDASTATAAQPAGTVPALLLVNTSTAGYRVPYCTQVCPSRLLADWASADNHSACP